METEMTLSWLSDLGKSVFGSMDGLFYTLVAFVVIDYITGVCVAIHNKQLSSDVGAHGIAKKIAIFALVSLSSVIDRFLLGSEDVLAETGSDGISGNAFPEFSYKRRKIRAEVF